MKGVSALLAVCLLFVLTTPAGAKESHPTPYLTATVLSVKKNDNNTGVFTGGNPSDAPLPDPETYIYDVSVHVNCGTYVGRYESWYDYLPSVFTPNQKIQLRLTRSVMYVPVPNQKEIALSIVSKHVERGPCESSANASAKTLDRQTVAGNQN